MRAYERFLNYIQYDTASDENSSTCPSTEKQLALGRALACELRAMGIADARLDEHGYVYGSIPANAGGLPAIGLIAHMDVVNCVPSAPMNASIVENYDGGPLTLKNGLVLDPAVFPEVAGAKGKRLIVTDGNTSLGADDKAGVAEIMTACERLLADPALKHGKICVAFTPDEEIGRGANRFDVAGFGADFAYTVDGGVVGDINYENFNAASGDHDKARFEARKARFAAIADELNGKYGPGTVAVEIQDSYYNMRQVIEKRMDIVERAFDAYRAVGVEPLASPVRGGTDGARLTFMGLPCPNVATGGMNFHGRFECVAIEDMDLMSDMLVKLVTE